MKESASPKSARFEKLKSLRAELCEREKSRAERIQQQKWLLEQFNDLKTLTECDSCSLEAVKKRIDQIVCELQEGADNE